MHARTLVVAAAAAVVVAGFTVPSVQATDSTPDWSQLKGATGTPTKVYDAATDKAGIQSLASGAVSTYSVALPAGCRIFDTRTSTKIAAGTSRDFSVLDGSLAGQGGNAAGCAIPADAVSVEVSMSTTGGSPTAAGFLRAGPGGTAPTATVLQFLAGQGTSVTTTVGLSASSTMRVAAFNGGTHVVADVLSYNRKILRATVSAGGSLSRGQGVSSTYVYNALTGYYIVQFERDVQECTPVVSADTGSSSARVYGVLNGPSVPREVFVYSLAYNSTTTSAAGFQLTMAC
jgi:hypothetical protein